jgi:hypothetical protein
MRNFIVPDGAYACRAYWKLAATGHHLTGHPRRPTFKWQKSGPAKRSALGRNCGVNAWAKPGRSLSAGMLYEQDDEIATGMEPALSS